MGRITVADLHLAQSLGKPLLDNAFLKDFVSVCGCRKGTCVLMLWLLRFRMVSLKNVISKRLAFEGKWKIRALIMEIVRLIHSLQAR